MPPSAPGSSMLKIRTLADDMQRAQGIPTALRTIAPASLQADIKKAVGDSAPATRPSTSAQVSISPHISASAPTPPELPPDTAFDIRHESTTDAGMAEATIINDRKVRDWSLMGAMQRQVQMWWKQNILPLFKEKQPRMIEGGIAPQAEQPVFTGDVAGLAPVPEVRTFASDVREVEGEKRSPLPPAPAKDWRRISEPREDAPLPHTSTEEARAHKADLHAARLRMPAPHNERQSIKTARPVRTPDGRTLYAGVGESDPRARLARLAETKLVAEPRVSRDIPFIPPTFTHQESSPIRTYRYDALSDIKERDLSKTQIATQELKQRDRMGVAPRSTATPPPHTRIIPILTVCTFILLLVVGGTLLIPRLLNDAPLVQVNGILSFFTTDAQTSVPFVNDRVALLESLNVARISTTLGKDATLHIPITASANASESAHAEEILRGLDFRIPGAYLRSLHDTTMFGAYGIDRTPFIILKTSHFETAFAGMLAWEEFMSVDLAPFFGSPVRRSYDQNALTNDHTRAAYFADVVIQNKDVRILYDEYGQERILYSFVSKDTLVIAGTSETLQALTQILQ